MAHHRVNYGLILVALMAVSVLPPALFLSRVEASQPWWNTDWQYRKAVAITSAASLSNYDVLVTVDTQALVAAGKMKSDGSDIRFVDASNAVLSYWIESPTVNTATTRIWVNATSISTSGTTVWMYYGNPSATAASNGASTFSFFDDDWNSFSQQSGNPVHTATQSWWESTVSYPNVFEDTSFVGRPRFHMLYDGHNVIGHAKGYATSPDLNTWTEYDGGSPHPPNANPILGIGYTGDSACAWGDPIKVGSTYYLYYSAGPGTIYRSESSDLINWVNLQPIVDPTSTTTFGVGAAVLKQGDGITPIVVDGKYWMVYLISFGTGSLYLASSTDLLNWTPWSGNPLLDPTPGGWDSGGLFTPSFALLNNTYYVYYEASGPLGWITGYAKANAYSAGNPITPDMTTWTKSSDAVLKHGPSGSWDDYYCIDPIIREFDGVYYVFYTGNVANGYAYSNSPDGPWTKYGGTPSALWTKGGTPTVSGGIVTLGYGSSLISTSTYLYSAVGFRANFVGSAQKMKWAGFIQGSTYDRTMVGTTRSDSLLYLKNYVSAEDTAQLSGVTLGNFHVYEVLWRNAKSMGVVDHGAITATLTTQVPTTALPVTFYNYDDGTYGLQVDWVFVRPYNDPEPTASVGSEEAAPGGYTLSVSVVGQGSVTLNSTGPYSYDDAVQLTAVPVIGWSFNSWSGDLSSSVNPATLTINGSMAVTATFTQNVYSLTVSVSPVGSGSVTLNNSRPYHYGDAVRLTAVPATSWSFDHWSGNLTGFSNPAIIFVTGDVSITANFALPKLYIDPPSTSKTYQDVGSYFNVSAKIENITGLFGFDLNVTWDNTLLTFASADFNTTLDNIWGGGHWYCAVKGSGPGYYKLVALSTAGSFNSTAPTPLCTLTFAVEDPQSNSARQTLIHFSTHKLSDSEGNSITHTVVDGTYTIVGKTATLQMSPTTVTCRVYGEAFTTQVGVIDALDVTGFKFEIHYNTTLLDYASITWNAWGSGVVTVDEANGNITGVTSGGSVSGTQTLITMQFNAAYYHIWKVEGQVPGWKNDQSGLIFVQWANLSYANGPDLGYVRGGSQNQINVGSDVTYTFSPIQGDVDNNGVVDIFDMRAVAFYYDQVNTHYDLNGDNYIDIFDLALIAGNFDYQY